MMQNPYVPVTEPLTQKETVTADADAVPHAKSAVLNPSIACLNWVQSDAPTAAPVVTEKNKLFEKPAGAVDDCAPVITAPDVLLYP